MRFAIAAGFLAQTLPVTSEIEDLVATTLEGNLEKVQRGNNVNPKILNGIRRKHGRKSGGSWLNERVQHNEALKNAPHDRIAVVECNPQKSADVGVLSCNPGKYCMESQSSSLGGVCTESAFSRPRSLQDVEGNGSIVEYYIQSRCNESSPYFDEYYGSICDCSGVDVEAISGTIVCQVYDNECFPFCNDTCVDATAVYSAQGPLQYGVSFCFEVNGPAGQETACYANYVNLAEGSFECTASWNGVNCTCDPYGNPEAECATTIDCPGDGPSGFCPNELLYQFTALGECLTAVEVCYICPEPGSTVNDDVILSLPGFDDNVSCLELNVYGYSGEFNSSFCPVVQAVAGPLCCTAPSMAPSAAMGNSSSTAPSATMGDETITVAPSAPSDSVAPPSSPPTASPTPASRAFGFAKSRNVVSFMGLAVAVAVYLSF